MIINDQNAHKHWSRSAASIPSLHRVRHGHGRREMPSIAMQPERCCYTFRLDNRLFYLSTLHSAGIEGQVRSQTKAISLLGK